MTTVFRQHTNNAVGALASAIDDNDLSLPLETGQGGLFPASGQFYLTIYETTPDEGEIVLIASRSGDTLTVHASGRGIQDTLAQGWDAGAVVALLWTAGDVEDLQAAIIDIEEGTTTLDSVTAAGAVTGATLAIGGGYGSSGLSVDASGNLSANGNVIADGDVRNAKFFSVGTSTGSVVTISSGSISPVRTHQRVDTEGAAATDDLDTIVGTGLQAGTILILRSDSFTRDVTIKHNTGNIRCLGNADIVLGNTAQRALLVWDAEASLWTATQLY